LLPNRLERRDPVTKNRREALLNDRLDAITSGASAPRRVLREEVALPVDELSDLPLDGFASFGGEKRRGHRPPVFKERKGTTVPKRFAPIGISKGVLERQRTLPVRNMAILSGWVGHARAALATV
jgi:hypothetical protein